MKRSGILTFLSVCFIKMTSAYLAANPDPNNPYDKCDYGRHLTRRCVGLTPDPADTYCPAGFFCYVPADGEGPCCRQNNPCSTGIPYRVNDDAVTCSRRKGCPFGHVCTTGKNFAVCCPSQTFQGCPDYHCPPVRPGCALPRYYLLQGRFCRHCDRDICPRPYMNGR